MILVFLLHPINSKLVLHELLQLGCIPSVNRSLGIINSAIVEDQLGVGDKRFDIVVLIRVKFMLHRTKV